MKDGAVWTCLFWASCRLDGSPFSLLSQADLASISPVSSHSSVRASNLVVSIEIETDSNLRSVLPPVISLCSIAGKNWKLPLLSSQKNGNDGFGVDSPPEEEPGNP